MIQLERYKGTKSRHTYPSCGARNCFVRYQNENGEYLATDVGRCNRESKCGYHKKPKDYFLENPTSNLEQGKTKKKRHLNYGFVSSKSVGQEVVITPPKQFDYISNDVLLETLSDYEQNSFLQFLLALFPEDKEAVWQMVKDYLIGTVPDGRGNYTCFPYIDQNRRVCKGKLIRI